VYDLRQREVAGARPVRVARLAPPMRSLDARGRMRSLGVKPVLMACTSSAQLSSAQLSPAQLSSAQPSSAQLSLSAQLSSAQLSPAQLSSAQPSPAQLSSAQAPSRIELAPEAPKAAWADGRRRSGPMAVAVVKAAVRRTTRSDGVRLCGQVPRWRGEPIVFVACFAWLSASCAEGRIRMVLIVRQTQRNRLRRRPVRTPFSHRTGSPTLRRVRIITDLLKSA
jgi:hypothetical protein